MLNRHLCKLARCYKCQFWPENCPFIAGHWPLLIAHPPTYHHHQVVSFIQIKVRFQIKFNRFYSVFKLTFNLTNQINWIPFRKPPKNLILILISKSLLYRPKVEQVLLFSSSFKLHIRHVKNPHKKRWRGFFHQRPNFVFYTWWFLSPTTLFYRSYWKSCEFQNQKLSETFLNPAQKMKIFHTDIW